MSRGRRIALAVLLVLALVGPAAGAWAQGQTPTGPITIGVLAPSTGPFATYARDIIDGARLYSDEVGGQLGGASSRWWSRTIRRGPTWR